MEQTMKELMAEIREVTKKQKSCNKVDEIRVMRTMLNDPDFEVSIYDKNKGLIGTRSPRTEAVKFISNVCSAVTGIDSKSADELANNYEFTKKDAIFLLDNSRDFTQTYLSTGRKINIVQSEKSQAELLVKPIPEKEKAIPAGDGVKQITKVPGYDKIVAKSKCPKYFR